jgi:hypothetical protein
MDVKAPAPVDIRGEGFTSRTNVSTGQKQVLTQDILRWLGKRLPADGFCLLGITMEDLYPGLAHFNEKEVLQTKLSG